MQSKHFLRLMPLILILLVNFYSCKSAGRLTSTMKLNTQEGEYQERSISPAFIDQDEEILDPAFNTEEYDVIKENTFKNVTSNPVSTFSIDVDTASYANMRRFLHLNRKPPKDAIRIEELINYFSYSYPEPRGEDPFSISLDLARCYWNDKHQIIRIGLKGKSLDTREIPPANLVFLLDVSGSMEDDNKLPLLKNAFGILVDRLRPEDRVSIVVYAGSSGVVLPPTGGDKKAEIMQALNQLNSGGSTAGSAGIKLAYQLAREHYIQGGNNRIILATDGDFNVGPSSDAELVRLIEQERENGVFLTILGFGMGNYKDSKMEQLSNAGNGNYAYIDTIMEAQKVLGSGIWGTLYTIAKDVKIQVEFNPAQVKAYRLIGYENRLLNKEDFEDDKKDAGEIGADHRVTAFYEIVPADSEEQVTDPGELKYQKSEVVKSDDVMTIKLRYKQPDSDTSKLIQKSVTPQDLKREDISEDFMFASAVAEFGMLLRDSEFKGNANYDQVLELARRSKGEDPDGYRAEFIKLVTIARGLD